MHNAPASIRTVVADFGTRHMSILQRSLRPASGAVLGRTPRCSARLRVRIRDQSPDSVRLGQAAGSSEARLAGEDDGLIAMLDADLFKKPRDVIANRFLRKAQRRGDRRVVEAAGDPFKDRELAWRELA